MGKIEAMKAYLIDSLSSLVAAEFQFEIAVDAGDDEESLALGLERVAVVASYHFEDRAQGIRREAFSILCMASKARKR